MSAPTDAGRALTDALAAAISGDQARVDEALDRLADTLASRIAGRSGQPGEPGPEGWLTTRAAADYLGMTPAALHKLTSAGAVPFEQEAPGCRCYFNRDELDRWQRAGRPRTSWLRAA